MSNAAPPKTPKVDPPSATDELASPPPRRKRPLNDLDKLRQRAKAAAAKARENIPVQLSVSLEVYEKLVELAETYHRPIKQIAKQCLIDGMRKYSEVSVPELNPFPIPVTRAFPETPAGLFQPPEIGVLTDEARDILESRRRPGHSVEDWMLPEAGGIPVGGETPPNDESEPSE